MEFSVGLTAVGRNGFNGCTALLDLGTDSYVTSRQFYSTPVLKLVDLRDCTSLEVIGSETFSTTRNTCTFLLDGCTALKAIYSSAFAGHGAAVELDLSGLSALELIDSNAFTRGKYIGTLVIPENVVTIGSYAFGNSAGCGSYNQFSKIDLSQSGSLETIGSYAFAYIPLQTVDFSGCTSLTAIGANAFRNDLVLTELDLSACASLASIGDNAFRDCVAVKTITIPAGVTSLASTAFTNCGAVKCSNGTPPRIPRRWMRRPLPPATALPTAMISSSAAAWIRCPTSSSKRRPPAAIRRLLSRHRRSHRVLLYRVGGSRL